MRLIHLAAYGGSYPGSFIPMVSSVLHAAAKRGWQAEAIFPAIAQDRSWVRELQSRGIQVRFAPSMSWSELRRWLAQVLEESAEPTICHTHFTSFDLPTVSAARKSSGMSTVHCIPGSIPGLETL